MAEGVEVAGNVTQYTCRIRHRNVRIYAHIAQNSSTFCLAVASQHDPPCRRYRKRVCVDFLGCCHSVAVVTVSQKVLLKAGLGNSFSHGFRRDTGFLLLRYARLLGQPKACGDYRDCTRNAERFPRNYLPHLRCTSDHHEEHTAYPENNGPFPRSFVCRRNPTSHL